MRVLYGAVIVKTNIERGPPRELVQDIKALIKACAPAAARTSARLPRFSSDDSGVGMRRPAVITREAGCIPLLRIDEDIVMVAPSFDAPCPRDGVGLHPALVRLIRVHGERIMEIPAFIK